MQTSSLLFSQVRFLFILRSCLEFNSAANKSIRESPPAAAVFPSFLPAIAMADQYQQTKDTASYKTEEAKQQAGGLGQAAKDKAGQVGQAGQEKWDQTKQSASDASGTTQQKAQEAKDKTGNVLQQAGDKVKEVIGNVTGNNNNQ